MAGRAQLHLEVPTEFSGQCFKTEIATFPFPTSPETQYSGPSPKSTPSICPPGCLPAPVPQTLFHTFSVYGVNFPLKVHTMSSVFCSACNVHTSSLPSSIPSENSCYRQTTRISLHPHLFINNTLYTGAGLLSYMILLSIIHFTVISSTWSS